MFPRQMYNPDAFQNVTEDGKVIGFSFQMKIQYYRGITLSIIRNIEVEVDGKQYPRYGQRRDVYARRNAHGH